MVRPEITMVELDSSPIPVGTTPAPKTHVSRRWVSFGFGADVTAAGRGEAAGSQELGRYRLEAVQTVRGAPPTGLAAGLFVSCREQEAPRPPLSGAHALSGVVEPGRCTPETTETALLRAWAGSPWRVGLLLAFRHNAAFWALPREQRGPTYLGLLESPRPAAHNARIMDRVLRRLFRVPSATSAAGSTSEWDYLAFFEMQPRDVAHLREHLAELRDRRANALFNHVNREAELWMTRQPPNRS